MHQLLPSPAAVSAAEAYADDRRRARDGRPWVLANMIASVDGATALDGTSGGLGGPADREVFQTLRSMADLVLVGAATVRAERYRAPSKPGLRVAVVTGSGDLDWSSSLFTSGAGFVITTEAAPTLPVESLRTPGDRLDLAWALGHLGEHVEAGVVLCEGGPSLNGQLLAGDLIDELCLTVSPTLVGGHSSRVMTSAAATPSDFDLAHVLEADGLLFLRYLRRGR